jgi:hypothetical protein
MLLTIKFIMKTKLENGILYPVLNADKKGYVTCSFCQQKHKHGKSGGGGHRVADCTQLLITNPLFTEKGWCKKENGYFVVFS